MKKKNILLIITDQQSATMMSCAGNKYLQTPALDSIAQNGVRFDRAYCGNPICVPSRFSMMTGRMPSEINFRSNYERDADQISDHIKENGLGNCIKKAGYDVVYGGKEHLPNANTTELGFNYLCKDERADLADFASDYIKNHDQKKPFFMISSFINPHDICLMAIRDFANQPADLAILKNCYLEQTVMEECSVLPEGVSEEEFFEKYCPPLPKNYEPQKDEPDAVRQIQEERQFKKMARENYTDKDWRIHRWTYVKLTERVDAQIGKVLQSVKDAGLEDDTVIMFVSDHGDMGATHRMEHKTILYEQSCNVPFMIQDPDAKHKNIVDKTHMVSTGLDILPTICDYAGVEPPKDIKGQSLKPIIQNGAGPWRDMVHVEAQHGDAYITKDFKYIKYFSGVNSEQLVDYKKNPWEMWNDFANPDYKDVLAEMKKMAEKF